MLPEIIIHNSVSIDGSISGFEADLELHYRLLGALEPEAILVGSNTAKTGIEMFIESVPTEEASDMNRPSVGENDTRPYWIMVDSRGILKGLLHIYRKMEYCKDVIVLVSERTPQSYISYLEERSYDYIISGKDHVNYKQSLETCRERYGFRRIVVDSGNTLCGILLDERLVDRISLVISPVIVGKEAVNLFGKVMNPLINAWKLLENNQMDSGHLHITYEALQQKRKKNEEQPV